MQNITQHPVMFNNSGHIHGKFHNYFLETHLSGLFIHQNSMHNQGLIKSSGFKQLKAGLWTVEWFEISLVGNKCAIIVSFRK